MCAMQTWSLAATATSASVLKMRQLGSSSCPTQGPRRPCWVSWSQHFKGMLSGPGQGEKEARNSVSSRVLKGHFWEHMGANKVRSSARRACLNSEAQRERLPALGVPSFGAKGGLTCKFEGPPFKQCPLLPPKNHPKSPKGPGFSGFPLHPAPVPRQTSFSRSPSTSRRLGRKGSVGSRAILVEFLAAPKSERLKGPLASRPASVACKGLGDRLCRTRRAARVSEHVEEFGWSHVGKVSWPR